jgi:hypothetical protein
MHHVEWNQDDGTWRTMFEAVSCGGARAAYQQLDLFERAEVDHIIRLIELGPYHVDACRTRVSVPPLVLSAYDNGTWQITYRIVDPFIEIYGITRVDSRG